MNATQFLLVYGTERADAIGKESYPKRLSQVQRWGTLLMASIILSQKRL